LWGVLDIDLWDAPQPAGDSQFDAIDSASGSKEVAVDALTVVHATGIAKECRPGGVMVTDLTKEQEQKIRAMVEEVAQAMVAKDLGRVAAMTASWLPAFDEGGWRRHIEEQLAEMASEWDVENPAWPTCYEIGSNPLSFDELVETNERAAAWGGKHDMPAGLNAANFRKRMHLTLMPDDNAYEFDYWCRWWLAVAEEDGTLKIGDIEVEP
jgi:hypothetical protein